MSMLAGIPPLKSVGTAFDSSQVDWFDPTPPDADPAEHRRKMADHGYLYLPGLLDRDEVMAARLSVCQQLARDGFLAPAAPLIDAKHNPAKPSYFKPEYATGNPVIEKLLYTGAMTRFFDDFFGRPTAHYDFTWLRAVAPGFGSASHCDVVYMGRGERQQLFTVWTPLGDIDFRQGGLMVLDGSNQFDPLKKTYGEFDVDTYCEGEPGKDGWKKQPEWLPGAKGNHGTLGTDPNLIRDHVGGTWRTTEYKAGDVLIFTCYTVHASMDNTSDRIRLSTDSRYQPAGTVQDPRWIGTMPGHGEAGKRGKVC